MRAEPNRQIFSIDCLSALAEHLSAPFSTLQHISALPHLFSIHSASLHQKVRRCRYYPLGSKTNRQEMYWASLIQKRCLFWNDVHITSSSISSESCLQATHSVSYVLSLHRINLRSSVRYVHLYDLLQVSQMRHFCRCQCRQRASNGQMCSKITAHLLRFACHVSNLISLCTQTRMIYTLYSSPIYLFLDL